MSYKPEVFHWLAVGLGALTSGCLMGSNEPASDAPASTTSAIQTENGFNSINGFNSARNGRRDSGQERVAALSVRGRWLEKTLSEQNGVSVSHPLAEDAGLSSGSGAMATPQGQLAMSYLVRCALPADRSLEKYDADGSLHRFEGAIGVAPEWEHGTCDGACQEWVSACLLAHVNLTGVHVPIWLTAAHPAIDWSTSEEYPNEEAGYFGNLFSAQPVAFVCFGRGLQVNPIPGRVCVGDATCPYLDPYLVHGGACDARAACSSHADGSKREGYESCSVEGHAFSHVVTVWKH